MVAVLAAVLLGLLAFAVWLTWQRLQPAPEPAETTAATTAPTETAAPTTEPTTVPTTEAPTEPPTEPPIPLNRFGAEDFGYAEGGTYLTCLTEPCLMGIDVSKYQKKVDWQQVKDAGFSFVMIRLGGRGYGESGGMYADDMAKTHYKNAKKAGFLIGAYFFSQAITVEEAVEEAEYALKLAKDWELELPIVFDWEYVSETARTAHVDADTLTACAIAFCDTIRAAGREAMIYYSPWFGNMHRDQLVDYPIWLALYKEEMTHPYYFDMWQYTCTGTVPGISGETDINIYFPREE